MSKPIFYEGQAVGCLTFGEGIVESFTDSMVYVKIDNIFRSFYENGAYHANARPTLYPIDQYREIIANLPAPQPEAWKPKPGEWCWFWDDAHSEVAFLKKFSSYDTEKSYPYLTTTGIRYENCAPFTGELPPHLKEVKP